MITSLTSQPTQLPQGFFWLWCEKCDGNPECGRCGGQGFYNFLWLLPLTTHKHGVINMDAIG